MEITKKTAQKQYIGIPFSVNILTILTKKISVC
jgi:hypothetical protein